MIRHLSPEQIDYEKWNNCIQQSVNGNIYALSWYLNLVSPEWEALVEGDYLRVMPLTVKTKLGFKYMLQPFFIQQLGVYSTSNLYPEKTLEFINSIPKSIRYFDINLNSHNEIKNIEFKRNRNFMLDLITDYKRLQSNYSSNNKRNIKKAGKSNLVLTKGIQPADVIKLFREGPSQRLTRWEEKEYITLERLMYMSIHKGMGVIYGVYTEENQLCAAAFFTRFKKRLTFLFSGSDNIAKENGAMSFLLDSVIQEYSPSETTLDFEGSNKDSLARFYKGFGSKEVYYLRVKENRLSFPFKGLLNQYLIKKQI